MINNPVNPAHYQKRGGFEVIDFIEAVCADLPGDEAALVMPIIKYVSRYRQKHPKDPVRDLKKGLWFLDRLIKMVEAKQGEVNLHDLMGAKNRKEDVELLEAVFKTNTPRPGDVVYACCGGRAGGKHFMSCEHYEGHY